MYTGLALHSAMCYNSKNGSEGEENIEFPINFIYSAQKPCNRSKSQGFSLFLSPIFCLTLKQMLKWRRKPNKSFSFLNKFYFPRWNEKRSNALNPMISSVYNLNKNNSRVIFIYIPPPGICPPANNRGWLSLRGERLHRNFPRRIVYSMAIGS